MLSYQQEQSLRHSDGDGFRARRPALRLSARGPTPRHRERGFARNSVCHSDNERGLLGIAFDPDFAGNQFDYVYYTDITAPIHNRVSRFTACAIILLRHL